MSQRDRREKIAALLDSPNEGERGAAQAALNRIGQPAKPEYGSKEWHAAVLEWCRKVEFCDSRRGSPLLSQTDVVLIRNISRSRGDPWMSCAPDLLRIYEKLNDADDSVHEQHLLEGSN